METMATRLIRLLDAKNGGNQSEMARYIGVTPQAVQKWMAGVTEPKGKNLQMAAEFLGVTPAELKFGGVLPGPSGEISVTSHPMRRADDFVKSRVIAGHPDDDLQEGMVQVPESRIEFSAGHGRVNYELVEDEEPATYRLSWFQKYGINPQKVRRFRVHGDSMVPMLYPRDTILVNTEETNVVDGRLYAIRYGDELRVKYLSRRLDGTLILRSLNSAYRDEEVPPEVAGEHITIIGRVRDKSGTGGL
jgi:phage repressor protein C with HTH and peptisase S24 domain